MSHKEINVVSDDELESQTLNNGTKKNDRKPSGDDPISDYLLSMYYTLNTNGMQPVKYGLFAVPFVTIFLFSIFVSNSLTNLIAFSALVISFSFMVFSLWILCWILDKDPGTRAMQDVSDPIKEGSEGFFIT